MIRHDLRHLAHALRMRDVAYRPAISRLVVDGTVNALRDMFRRPRANLPAAGDLRLHYTAPGGAEPQGSPPWLLRHWFRRIAPVAAAAAQRVYTNDDTPLLDKLPRVSRLLARQVNLLDLLGIAAIALATSVMAFGMHVWDRVREWMSGRRLSHPLRGFYRRYVGDVQRTCDLTPTIPLAARRWEERLARLPYRTVRSSHIHISWPQNLAEKNEVVHEGLWHVCPAHVYEARVGPSGQVQVIANFENCIKCETCWRVSPQLVDWGRDGRHRFSYAVSSPVVTRVMDAAHTSGAAAPVMPKSVNWWTAEVESIKAALSSGVPDDLRERLATFVAKAPPLIPRLEQKLLEFEKALSHERRTVDRPRAEYLETLARYAQQLGERIQELLAESTNAAKESASNLTILDPIRELISSMVTKLHERTERTWNQHYAWAAGDGRQIRFHYLAGLRRLTDALADVGNRTEPESGAIQPWLRTEEDAATVADEMVRWVARLDAVLPPGLWKSIDRGQELPRDADTVLRNLITHVPRITVDDSTSLHPPIRKAILAELGRRDPSLAYRVANHLWARDAAQLAAASPAWSDTAERLTRADEWACFALVDPSGETLFTPAVGTELIIAQFPDHLVAIPTKSQGVSIESLPSLGLRGAGISRLSFNDIGASENSVPFDLKEIRRAQQILAAADLVAIASGMADVLCRRAIEHATGRVQFPGLFHDEMAHDTIGKFGAVKRMVAEMSAGRFLIETLSHTLSPCDWSSAELEKASLVKALIAEVLGTSPGSISYNAGQVFGGTGFSEDDILAKYYRDAAAWRFLGVPNTEVYRRHGNDLLSNWRSDGQSLAYLLEEGEIFEELTQRKALQAELDEVRNARSRIRSLVADWQANGPKGTNHHSFASSEIAELLARQNAYLLGSKALVLRTHARLEAGHDAETPIALLRVWLERAAAALTEFEGTVRHWLDSLERVDDRPLVDPASGSPLTTYTAFTACASPYDSGDFLTRRVSLDEPRLVPEMIQTDPELAKTNQEIRRLLENQFGKRHGMPYERYIERQHRPDEDDLDFCRRHGFFRMTIAKELGGEGRRKVDYYLVASNTQRMVDVGISLSIQVNTGLGTTPVFLARYKDLPKAEKEVGAFVRDTEFQKRFSAMIGALDRSPSVRNVESLQKLIEGRVQPVAALKSHAAGFLKTWKRIAEHIRQGQPAAAVRAQFSSLDQAWDRLCESASEFHGELQRRIKACDQFLQWVSQGQISAFALTEPSAGSDTARVATRARLRSVAVEADANGVFRFTPYGRTEHRTLLDARRLEFRGDRVFYRGSEQADAVPISFDEYDYETDDPSRTRYLDFGSRKLHFTDIAQLRERDGKLLYDYWEITGAKMWITNGRMMGIMCLYAKTDDGVTGFIVDRHAEGLIVGKDEDKLGQCGSPTNEISLQMVRVPRENVMGLEGRGQVNALETLNVGRAGLGMSAMAQMEALIEWSRYYAGRQNTGEIPEWIRWRLQRMEEIRYTSEALAYEVAGRFEHPQTKSVRIESAIAKLLISELLHQVIELAEDIHGLDGQTQRHLVEKRKRDARVLTIYEGTNEIQRFFILRDLASEVAPRWKDAPTVSKQMHQDAIHLEWLKGELRQRVQSALAVFGASLAQNPNLQANCFILADAAAWLKAADSTLGRNAWLARRSLSDEDGEASPQSELGRSALARCFWEVRHRLSRFDEELTFLRRGFYAPEVRAADLLFETQHQAALAYRSHCHIDKPLSVLVLLDAATVAAPQPLVVNGRLLEAHRTWSEPDQTAVESALRLKDSGGDKVTIRVVAFGSRAMAASLRELLSCGTDQVTLIVTDDDAITPDSAAAAIATVVGGPNLDLLIGGAGETGSQDGLVARLAAEMLGVAHAGTGAEFTVQTVEGAESVVLTEPGGQNRRIRPLPAAIAVNAGAPLRAFTIEGYFNSLPKSVEIVRWPKKAQIRQVLFEEQAQVAQHGVSDNELRPLSPDEAAERVLSELGLTGSASRVEAYGGRIEDVTPSSPLSALGIMVVLATDSKGRLTNTADSALMAARLAEATWRIPIEVLLVAPIDESAQRMAVASLIVMGVESITLVPAESTSEEIRARLLADIWPEFTSPPRVVIGEPWLESAFARLTGRTRQNGSTVLRVRGLKQANGTLVVSTTRDGGKLTLRQTLTEPMAGHPLPAYWMSLAAGADVAFVAVKSHREPQVRRWSPRLDRFYGQRDIQRLVAELKQTTGLIRLSDADFIIDVGFGIGNQDGYEAVIEPLIRVLEHLGVRYVVGGSRKVTEELHLLDNDRQIGQSGVSVNPQLLIAIGISGAPQHLNYIGPRATIIAFNRDPEAPIMTLNQRQSRPRVFPVLGDLLVTVPALTAALGESLRSEQARNADATQSLVSVS